MKKILTFFAIMATICTTRTYAQDLKAGVQLSPAFSWMSTDDNKITPQGTNLGIKVGLVAEYMFRENYSFSTGINLFSNSGGKLAYQFGGHYWTDVDYIGTGITFADTTLLVLADGVNLRYQVSYWEVPFGFKMRGGDEDGIQYFAELPIITLGFRSKSQGDIIKNSVDVQNLDIKGQVAPLQMSWGLGAGVEYPLGAVKAVGGFYYHQGFTDVTQDNGWSAITNANGVLEKRNENSKATIRNITIRLGIMF